MKWWSGWLWFLFDAVMKMALAAATILEYPPANVRPPAFKAHRLVYHSTLGFRVIKKKKKKNTHPAPERRGDSLQRFKDLYLTAKTRLWP